MNEVQRVRNVYLDYDRRGRTKRWAGDEGIHAERRVLLGDLLASIGPIAEKRVLDLGCGRGNLIDDLAAAGVDPVNVIGVDLLPHHLATAQGRGVSAVVATSGALPFPGESFDLILAFTLLSSIGHDAVLRATAEEIGRLLRPGGALIVYDMRLPNPGNRAVRSLPLRRLRSAFPGWEISGQSCTLLPPLARRVDTQPHRYDRLARIALLRSHRLSVLRPAPSSGMGLPPLPARPSVSVIMPVRNEGRFIERSLGAVLAQAGVPPPQVIVVDGQSEDGTRQQVRALAVERRSRVLLVENSRRIVPAGMNLGLARATGDVIVRVDGHCVVAPDYVRRCLEVLRHTGVECVGGPIETVGETQRAAAIAAAQSSRFGVGGVAFRTSTTAALVDTVAFGAYRREVFLRIGGFDEAFARNEDDEFNLRLTRAGGRIWMDPAIRSRYYSRSTWADLGRQYYWYGFYKVGVMRKHRTISSLRHLVPAAFVLATGGSVALSSLRRSPWPAALAVGPYAIALAIASRRAATSNAPWAAIARACVSMHLSYGVGWWAGALRLVGAFRVAGRTQPCGGGRSPA